MSNDQNKIVEPHILHDKSEISLAQFGISSQYLKLEAVEDISYDGEFCNFRGIDPRFRLSTTLELPAVAEFILDCETASSLVSPKLYADYGYGMSEANALHLAPAGKGRLSTRVAAPGHLRSLRFDPAERPGDHRLVRMDLLPYDTKQLWQGLASAALPQMLDAFYRDCLARDDGEALHIFNLDLNGPQAAAAGFAILEKIDPKLSRAFDKYVSTGSSSELDGYLRSGKSTSWYTSTANIDADLDVLLRSGQFDFDRYELQTLDLGDRFLQGQLSIEQKRRVLARHYLVRGAHRGLRPAAGFDPGFYTRTYLADQENDYVDSFVHYLRQGKDEGRFTQRKQLDEAVDEIRDLIDINFYRLQAKLGPDEDSARHYVQKGYYQDIRPLPDFCPQYYIRRYNDIACYKVLALKHYVLYGRAEGRRASIDSLLKTGQAAYDPAKPTVLMANHDASRTGAPIVGLALAEYFRATHNVVTYLGRGGELEGRFKRISTMLSVGQLDPLDAEYLLKTLENQYPLAGVIVNSVESAPLAMAALLTDTPCVALLHEFAEYTRPDGKLADVVAAADRVIVPAELVRASIARECERHFGFAPTNVQVKPQGYIVPERRRGSNDLTTGQLRELTASPGGQARKIVLGGGYVQIRKGVDLFIQTAAEFRRRGREDVCFVWVGEGYNPQSDMTYALWLREMVGRSDLAGIMRFLPAQQDFSTMLSACDVFYLPSRLDPYPNVVIDALAAAKPVVCFEKATGVAELFSEGRADGEAVAYCDVAAAADGLAKWLNGDGAARTRNAELVRTSFRFDHYAEAIGHELEQARQAREKLMLGRDALASASAFDPAFHEGDPQAWADKRRLATSYVARALKGFAKFNPRPGFADGLYRAEHGALGKAVIPLLDALARDTASPRTHDCIDLLGATSAGGGPPRTVVHLHLHYPDLAPMFLDRLNLLQLPIDLVVTSSGERNVAELKLAFYDYEWGEVEVMNVPNRGRDIGPFVTAVLPHILTKDYAVVGHFHSKKTLAAGGAMGAAWRTYLLDTLFKDRESVSFMLGRFRDDPALGLLFAEDRHSVGWSANLDIAQAFAARIGGVELPAFPVFPLGTMFWGRPAALASLAGRLDWPDYPVEPIGEDATILHALERMLPSVCTHSGYLWQTVYRGGASW